MLQLALIPLLLAQTLDPVSELSAGRAALAAGDTASATLHLQRAADAFPTWGLAQIELADVLLRADAPDAQRLATALEAARRFEPENPRSWALSGRWYELRGEAAPAIEAYRRSLVLRPESLELVERLGLLLAQAGAHAEALPYLQQLVVARPQDSAGRANLADAYERTGNLAAAEAELSALVQRAPGSAVFRRRLAQFLERTGRPERAAQVLREGESGRPARKMRELPPSKR